MGLRRRTRAGEIPYEIEGGVRRVLGTIEPLNLVVVHPFHRSKRPVVKFQRKLSYAARCRLSVSVYQKFTEKRYEIVRLNVTLDFSHDTQIRFLASPQTQKMFIYNLFYQQLHCDVSRFVFKNGS